MQGKNWDVINNEIDNNMSEKELNHWFDGKNEMCSHIPRDIELNESFTHGIWSLYGS